MGIAVGDVGLVEVAEALGAGGGEEEKPAARVEGPGKGERMSCWRPPAVGRRRRGRWWTVCGGLWCGGRGWRRWGRRSRR